MLHQDVCCPKKCVFYCIVCTDYAGTLSKCTFELGVRSCEPTLDMNSDLVQANPGRSDASGRWRKTEVEQEGDLHRGSHDLALVVDLLSRLCCWGRRSAENARRAKLEASSSSFVFRCDQWAVACFNKISLRKKVCTCT